MNNLKYRHELKYFINYGDYIIMKSRLNKIMKPDKNSGETGEYFIRSLYFDDLNDKALFEKISGVNHREKFRIRFYNEDSNFIKLEKKIKNKNLTLKTSTTLTKSETEDILNNNFEWLKTSDKDILKELYIKMKSRLYKPKTIVDYDREAYIYPMGNIRVTFDKRVRSGIYSTELFKRNLPTVEVIEPGIIILEIKFDEFIPELITDIIQTGNRVQTAVSKYALCRAYS